VALWVLNKLKLTLAVLFFIDELGHLSVVHLAVLVGMLTLLENFYLLARLLGLSESLVSLGAVFEWPCENCIALSFHHLKKNYNI
jgi:hypothetical protein